MHWIWKKIREGWVIGLDTHFAVISGARIFEFDCNNPRLWNTWIRDKYLNVIDKTSYTEMKKQEQDLIKMYPDTECVADPNQQCVTQRHWQSWKPEVTKRYKNWMYRAVLDGIDIVCRLGIPRFINDYIYDMGLNEAVSSSS